MSNTLHPELFEKIPLTGDIVYRQLGKIASETHLAEDALDNVSIVIRVRNEEEQLRILLNDIEQQVGANDAQIIIVDGGSTDGTYELAKQCADEVRTITPDEFTYPLSMNRGVEACDNPVVYLTVGHARLTNNKTLVAIRNGFTDPNLGGMYGTTLPNANASATERAVSTILPAQLKKPYYVHAAAMGVLGATSAAIAKDAWEEYGTFDERFQSGGEDTDLARKMLEDGRKVMFHPLLSVHHTHGLSLPNYVRQVHAWRQMAKGPTPLDRKALLKRRPDLQG